MDRPLLTHRKRTHGPRRQVLAEHNLAVGKHVHLALGARRVLCDNNQCSVWVAEADGLRCTSITLSCAATGAADV